MKTLFTKLKNTYGKLRVFRSVFGLSFAAVFIFIVFGVPYITHASLASDIAYAIADYTVGLAAQIVGYIILTLANLIIYLVGSLFDEVIIYTVFQFGDYFGNSAGLLAGWGAIRDVANIVLIFGFVMLGMATILDIHGYEVKKTLPRLIIFAILLNFSLLASEAVIDTSNAFASLLYSQASQTCPPGSTQEQCAASGSNGGLSGAIFKLSGTASAFSYTTSGSNGQATAGSDSDHFHKAVAFIGMAVFVTVLAVVLLAGAVMLITRGIVLAILMILSPLGFAGLAVPMLEKYAKDWWHRLLSQAFFAPVYLLLILVGLKIGQGITGQNVNLMSALLNGQSTAIGSVVIFSLLVGFMVAALMAAKQMGAMGASFATGMATAAVSYPFAVLGRNTAGRAASRIGGRFQNWVGSANKGGLGKFAAGALKISGGDQAIYGGLKKVSGAKFGSHASFDEQEKIDKEFASHAKHAAEAAELKDALAENNKDLAEKIAQKMSMSTLKETIAKCSKEELNLLGEVLSADTYDKLMNDKDVSPDAQHELGHGRFGSFDYLKDPKVDIDTMKSPDRAALQKKLRDLGTKDAELLAKYDSGLFTKIIEASNDDKESLLNDEQNEFLAKSNNISRELRQAAKQNSKAGRVESWVGTAKHADAVALFGNLNAEDKMKVKASTIADNAELLDTFHAPDVNAALVKSKFNKAQMQKMKTALKAKTGTDKAELDAFFAPGSLQNGLIGGWTP